ncbi:MAG: 4Fe-4S binding protein, partial [Ruminococcus sp.]|nr:4Fe-4S binding protein [Ruminococcus sp.]
MSIYEKKEQCCGCSACANVCPKQCITMNEDEEGFLYPTVDYDLCINCGLCEKVCSFKKIEEKNSVLEAYGCNAISDDIRKISSSGGIFSLLAKCIISQGGVVFGTAMTDDCKSAFLLRIETEDEIGRL